MLPQQSVCFSHTFLHIRLSASKKVLLSDTYSAHFTQHKSQFIMLQLRHPHTKKTARVLLDRMSEDSVTHLYLFIDSNNRSHTL